MFGGRGVVWTGGKRGLEVSENGGKCWEQGGGGRVLVSRTRASSTAVGRLCSGIDAYAVGISNPECHRRRRVMPSTFPILMGYGFLHPWARVSVNQCWYPVHYIFTPGVCQGQG